MPFPDAGTLAVFSAAALALLVIPGPAVLYIVATVALARSGPTARRVAFVACTVELTGVLVIGTASVIWPDAFPDETVWSAYGRGYGFVPLVLPVLGLLWLRRSGGARQRRRGQGERV